MFYVLWFRFLLPYSSLWCVWLLVSPCWGDDPIIGAATLYMWGRWVSFSELVMEMEGDMEWFQLVARPYEIKTQKEEVV
jgi:hypothetical protein